MTEEEFENFENEWYENIWLNEVDPRGLNPDIIEDILSTLRQDMFNMLREYNKKINEKKNN